MFGCPRCRVQKGRSVAVLENRQLVGLANKLSKRADEALEIPPNNLLTY